MRKILKAGAILFLIAVSLYLVYSAILFVQFSNNYHKWSGHKINSYSISVSHSKSGFWNGSQRSQVVANGKVVQGRDIFIDQPIIDWAFDHASFCAPAWILCALFGWSFQYEPTYGYPSRIEYNEYDGHYTIILTNITPLPEQFP
jgi:hypothetical protein